MTKKQSNRLTLQFNNLELGHYDGIPKPHEVNLFLFPFLKERVLRRLKNA